jgi:hypothetical protein
VNSPSLVPFTKNALGVIEKELGGGFAVHGGRCMETIDEVIARAMERGAKATTSEPIAISARFDAAAHRLFIELAGNVELSIPADQLGFPAGADLSGVRVEGGGFDLYFPAIDEGAFVPDLARAAIEHRLAA